MDHLIAELVLADIIRTNGWRREDPPIPVEMATRLLGKWSFEYVPPGKYKSKSRLRREGWRTGQWVIEIAEQLSPGRENWLISWQLARWILEQLGVQPEHANRLRAPLAAAILIPTLPLLDVLPHMRLEELCSHFAAPMAAMALRVAEIASVPTVLVYRGRFARIRGDEVRLFEGCSFAELDSMASGTVIRIGVQRTVLHDEPGQPVLLHVPSATTAQAVAAQK